MVLCTEISLEGPKFIFEQEKEYVIEDNIEIILIITLNLQRLIDAIRGGIITTIECDLESMQKLWMKP